MRPNSHRPILITAWQRKPNRNALVERINALAKELSILQAEMHGHLAGPAMGKQGNFFEDSTAVEALNHLKAELDQLRRILWFHIEQAAEKPLARTDQQDERAPAAPRALVAQTAGSSSSAEPGWFFDRLNLVIDSYIQKKPAAAETKLLSRTDTKAFS